MKNNEIAAMLSKIADLLELQGVQFKPMAYRRAAGNIQELSEDIEEIYKKGMVEEIEGVGKSIASRISEYLKTGRVEYLEQLREELPEGMEQLVEVEGIGPKTAFRLSKEFGFKTVEELEKAINNGTLEGLSGFGKKKAQNILRGIELYKASKGKLLLVDILPIANSIEKQLRKLNFIQELNVAGSIRRKKETIRDIDILVSTNEPIKVMDAFTNLKDVKDIISKGEDKCTVTLYNNIQVDLRAINKNSYGSALLYFTGSKEHNIKLRKIARKKNWKLNEYGLFDNATNDKLAGTEELELYNKLGLDYIVPELREERGEIEAAAAGTLPKLVERNEIKGDLHIHSKWSDGMNTIEELCKEAIKYGYEYIAICDHSHGLPVVKGLNESDIRKQMKEIELINRKTDNLTVLSGIELNIDKDGGLDIKDNVLKDLDVVIASVHSGFKADEKAITERVIKAMHNDYITILGHPSGRIINRRSPLQLNLIKVFENAVELGTIMEINAYPDRLDLSDVNCYKAREFNLKFSINTDTHRLDELGFIDFGVFTARRGWLEQKDVVNTLSNKDLKKIINL
ncbi:MAG: DNA polymerase/3'-5' exonuclease PolX [Candidatus Heimdallarchaeota archaeon]